jgi:hypothetical protein
MRIIDCVNSPHLVPLKRLVGLTREYYNWSSRCVEKPRSNYHRWYYVFANECERRGYSLERVLKNETPTH